MGTGKTTTRESGNFGGGGSGEGKSGGFGGGCGLHGVYLSGSSGNGASVSKWCTTRFVCIFSSPISIAGSLEAYFHGDSFIVFSTRDKAVT